VEGQEECGRGGGRESRRGAGGRERGKKKNKPQSLQSIRLLVQRLLKFGDPLGKGIILAPLALQQL
jgi:hypothetical protein